MDQSSAYNSWTFVSLSPLPSWALAAVLALVTLGVLLAALGVRREPSRRRRILLWSLRALAGLAAALFVLEPGVRQLMVAPVKNRVVVLVDRSASMRFASAANQGSRDEQVQASLSALSRELEELRRRFTVELYGFDGELSPLAPGGEWAPPSGSKTDLLAGLRLVGGEGGASKKLSGVLLFSDGADNGELASGGEARARQVLAGLSVPISTVVVGRENPVDLSIENVRVDDFAFVRNAVSVEVTVGARGLKGEQVPVVLRREGQVLATKSLTFESADEEKQVAFTFTPDQTGRFVYTLTTPVFPNEVVTENNLRSFTLKVIRDRVRLLLVVGRPSWDERFLRGLLKQDPNVDLVSFYILRTTTDEPMVRDQERELSLIPFPMEEIFDTKLDTFDVVVFQNFGYTEPALSIAQYERNLERYIHNGGAFLMIGGDRAFGEGRANLSTLAQALPVEPVGLPADPTSFRVRLSEDGQRHPITALGTGGTSSDAIWAGLPSVPGLNLTRARPEATVLLEHPHLTVAGKNAPVLALWEYGRGRAMALTIDSSWYWGFTAHAKGAQSRHYERFFGNALRWLVRDPELTNLSVVADPPAVEPGRPVGAVVTARLPDYQPARDALAKVDLYSVEEQRVVASQTATTGPEGTARIEFPSPAPGAYLLKGSASRNDTSLGEAQDAVAVRAVGPELSDARVRPETLERLARLSGGRLYREPPGTLKDLPLLDPPLVEVGRSKDQPVWNRWYFLTLLIALLGSEWVLRRRFGYI